MVMPTQIMEMMKNFQFSAKLRNIIKRLFDEDYDVSIHGAATLSSSISDPLMASPNIIKIYVKKDILAAHFGKEYACMLPLYSDDSIFINHKGIYDSLADNIYNDIFAEEDESKPRILTASKEEALFLKNFKEELKNRGDFTIDIPKLVDVLFKLGIMKPKEE